jgi:ribose transport system ATP-binding protein
MLCCFNIQRFFNDKGEAFVDTLLKMEGISKSFPGVIALSEVNFSTHRGEICALIGENGAGKSTLMKILCGVYQPDTGSMYLEDVPYQPQNPRAAQEQGVSIVFQELNICPHLTVMDNIFLSRHRVKYGLVDDRWLYEQARRILDTLESDINPKTIVNTLSVSEMQIIEIARALSFDARILVLDEPTSALTQREAVTLFRIIRKLRDSGLGIIYISHRLAEIHQICDSVTVLRDGKQIGETHRLEDITVDKMVSLMVGRDLNSQFPKVKREIGDIVFEAFDVKCKKLNVKQLIVRAGEIVGIAGLVGAGRSELARAIFAADHAESKTIRLYGREIEIATPHNAIENGIVYLPENRKTDGLALSMNVESNINLSCLKKLMSCRMMDEKKCVSNAMYYINRLSIKTPGIRQLVQYLSGGNQQKVVIAKALSNDVKVIIFDEPTRGIDVGAKYEIYQLINELSKAGVAIIFISSELPEILGMSDRILVMHNGTITGELAAKEATQEKILQFAAGILN